MRIRFALITTAAVAALGLAASMPASASTAQTPPAPAPSPAPGSLAPAVTPSDTYGDALCDEDGPCLNAQGPVGYTVISYTFEGEDAYQTVGLARYWAGYGCTTVTSTCPFTGNAAYLDEVYFGDVLVALDMTNMGGCAQPYPSTEINVEPCSYDRTVFVYAEDASGSYYFPSPYWSNHYGTEWDLYGQPLNDQDTVAAYTGGPREEWVFRTQ
jgi:hypothetical protein